MKSAVEEMYSAVKKVDFQTNVKHRVFYNYSGKVTQTPKIIMRNLCEQLTHPIKWEQIMHTIYARTPGEEFPHTYEVGPGRQLGYILRLTNEKAHYKNYHHIQVWINNGTGYKAYSYLTNLYALGIDGMHFLFLVFFFLGQSATLTLVTTFELHNRYIELDELVGLGQSYMTNQSCLSRSKL